MSLLSVGGCSRLLFLNLGRRPRWCCHRPPSLFLSGSCGLPRLPLAVKRRTAEGLGRRWWGWRLGGVWWVSCSLSLPYYRFMGAQSFSKYLPFPLYCGRLMAFDVGGGGVYGGWRCRGSGCWDGGREECMDR